MFKSLAKQLLIMPYRFCRAILKSYEIAISKLIPQAIGLGRQQIINFIDTEMRLTEHGSASFLLHTPNHVCQMRHSTFSSKEPEMLEWIEQYGGGAFFDVGANIGIYSLYYAQSQEGNIYSFEPSAFNLRQLAKNVSVNNLSDRITILPNPLSDKTGAALFINGNEDEGGAMSAFGVDYGHDGNPIDKDIRYSVMGFSLDDLFDLNILTEAPSLIKIDVDGIEHLILKGAEKTLRSDTLKSLYIEVNDDFEAQAKQVSATLQSAGFVLREKRHADMFSHTSTFNQIWVKEAK